MEMAKGLAMMWERGGGSKQHGRTPIKPGDDENSQKIFCRSQFVSSDNIIHDLDCQFTIVKKYNQLKEHVIQLPKEHKLAKQMFHGHPAILPSGHVQIVTTKDQGTFCFFISLSCYRENICLHQNLKSKIKRMMGENWGHLFMHKKLHYS